MIPVAAQSLAGGYGVRAGQPGEAVDRVHLDHRREVQYALAGTDNIGGCLRDSLKAEHTTPPQPEGRRHRREIGRAVLVDRADEDDRRAEVEDRRFYTRVSHRHSEFLILIDSLTMDLQENGVPARPAAIDTWSVDALNSGSCL